MHNKGYFNASQQDLSKASSLWTLVCKEDFFRDKLSASKLIAVARSAGCALSESTCKPVDPGGGDGGSLTMHGLAWPVAWASLLELLLLVVVSMDLVAVSAVFLGGMME